MPPRSIVVNPTTPSNTLSFNLPPGVTIDVESVLAAIDASGAGDTTATLTIADSSGAVIARKRQTEVVTAGTSAGSATWALRLADDNAAAQSIDTTNGVTHVNPTSELLIGSGLVLTDLGSGIAELTAPPAPASDQANYIELSVVSAALAAATPNGTRYAVDWNALAAGGGGNTDDDTGATTLFSLASTVSYTNYAYNHLAAPISQLKIIREGVYFVAYRFGPRVTFSASSFQVMLGGRFSMIDGNEVIQWINTGAFDDTNAAYLGGLIVCGGNGFALPTTIPMFVGQLSGGGLGQADASVHITRLRGTVAF